MARQYGDRINIVGMPGRDEVPAMRDFVARHDLGHILHLVDTDGTLWKRFDVPGQPAWVFIDAEGNVVRKAFGPLSDAEFALQVDALTD